MNKREIVVDGKVVKVDDKFYKEYIKLENNEKYINRKEQKKNLFYYNSLDKEDMTGEEIIANPREISVFDEVIKNIEIENLKNEIKNLDKKERIIIDLLFFKFLNESEVAKILKMSNQNVNYFKKKILKKLYKILNKKI